MPGGHPLTMPSLPKPTAHSLQVHVRILGPLSEFPLN